MNKQMILDPFNNVVASGVAVCDLNKLLGTVLEKLTLTLGGTTFTKAMTTKIELKANGKTIFETDGSKLDASNLYNGGAADATILKMDFMDRKAVTVNARQAGAIDLSAGSGISTLRLEVTTSGATALPSSGLVPLTQGVTESRPPATATVATPAAATSPSPSSGTVAAVIKVWAS